MSPKRIAGIVLLVLGVILFVTGVHASDSFADQVSNFFTGHFTDTTVWYMVGGAVACVLGLLLAASGGRD